MADDKPTPYNVKTIVGFEKDYLHYTHFAIHKPTNAIVFSYDYSEMYEKEPKKPTSSDKGAMTKYKNNLANYKEVNKDVNKELNSFKADYFFEDIIDTVGKENFRKKDYEIVSIDNLKKYKIDLKKFDILESINSELLEHVNDVYQNPLFFPVEKIFSASGSTYVSDEIETYEYVENGAKAKEYKKNICLTETNQIIGFVISKNQKIIEFGSNVETEKYIETKFNIVLNDVILDFDTLDELDEVFSTIFNKSIELENKAYELTGNTNDVDFAYYEFCNLVFPKESVICFLNKFYKLLNVSTPYDIIKSLCSEQTKQQISYLPKHSEPVRQQIQDVIDAVSPEFADESPYPYGIDSEGQRVYFTKDDVSAGTLNASGRDLVAFIAPFSFDLNLDVSKNEIQILELLGNFNGVLDCSFNKIEKLVLPYGYNNHLNCANNFLETIEIGTRFSSSLDCSFNRIKSIDLRNKRYFKGDLICNNNMLTELFLHEDFDSFINCSGNKLTELILPENFNAGLNCAHNEISELNIPYYFNSMLNCSHNRLTNLVLPVNYNMSFLWADGNVNSIEGSLADPQPLESQMTETPTQSDIVPVDQQLQFRKDKEKMLRDILVTVDISSFVNQITRDIKNQMEFEKIQQVGIVSEYYQQLDGVYQQQKNRAEQLYEIGTQMYQLDANNIPEPKFNFKVGDFVNVVVEDGSMIETQILETKPNYQKIGDSVMVEKVVGMSDVFFDYDNLRPLPNYTY